MLEVGKEYFGYTVTSFYTKGCNRMAIAVHTCGAERKYSIYELEKGLVRNCKHCTGHRADLHIGSKNEDGWVVIGHGYWGGKSLYLEARHTCGQVRKFTPSHFKNNLQECKKCTARVAYRKPLSELAINNKLTVYRRAARKRDLEFSLSREEFASLIFGDCTFCGRAPLSEYNPPRNLSQKWRREVVYTNGVDRLNNDLGYTAKNSVSCCWPCNKIKGDTDIDTWVLLTDLWSKNRERWIGKIDR